jgi:GTP:adenosylcobinamide-phosphate guanylyltransferase
MENSENNQIRAYASPLDAIVLAGTDDNPRRMIRGQNKAFLEIGGKTLVRRVAEALLQAATIGQVFVVGPSERLRRVLGDLGGRITIVEQAGKMLSNAWQAIYAAEARFRECHGRDDPQRPLLFISSDLPLVSAAAIDDFVARCAREDSRQPTLGAMLAGVAEEASLSRYYPDERGPGIQRPYVHLAECKVRLANIYVGRPARWRTRNFCRPVSTTARPSSGRTWWGWPGTSWVRPGVAGGVDHAAPAGDLLAARARRQALSQPAPRQSPQRILNACGMVLGGTVRLIITPWGGSAWTPTTTRIFRCLASVSRSGNASGRLKAPWFAPPARVSPGPPEVRFRVCVAPPRPPGAGQTARGLAATARRPCARRWWSVH